MLWKGTCDEDCLSQTVKTGVVTSPLISPLDKPALEIMDLGLRGRCPSSFPMEARRKNGPPGYQPAWHRMPVALVVACSTTLMLGI